MPRRKIKPARRGLFPLTSDASDRGASDGAASDGETGADRNSPRRHKSASRAHSGPSH
jgi:hypothetical protein